MYIFQDYRKARHHLQELMRLEPGNQQAKDLMLVVSQRLRKGKIVAKYVE
jgi:hypothetical protein